MKILVALVALTVAVHAEDCDPFNNFDQYVEHYKPNISFKDVTFTLYTRKHEGNGVQMFLGDKESIKKAGFDPSLPVRIGTHGWMADACGPAVQCLRKAFHAQYDCNFISIDWSKYARNVLYDEAALAVKPIGLHVSRFLRFLRDETKIEIKNIHAVGHSLGAHLLSFISDEFPKEKIGRITGLDPASPLFQNLPKELRLDSSDALFVDVIHTNTVYLGIREPCGTVDFYVNGGNNQPGCDKLDFQCNHNMSHRYFIYTVKTNKNYDAVKCECLKDAECGECKGEKAPMGVGATAAKPGIYYAKITEVPDSCTAEC